MTTTEALLDANALIAAFFVQHVHNARARRAVERLETFYTCPMTQGAFLRFLTRPWKNAAGQPQPPLAKPADALAMLRSVTQTASHAFLPDDVSFDDVSLLSLSGHKQWTDAYLLRLARRHNLKLLTLEEKMDNMDAHSVLAHIA